VDVLREPVLILDKELSVMAANECFYNTFKVNKEETENELIFDLGSGQWNIPELRKLLEDILPKHTFFKSFEVTHDFPNIGRKVMLLNARQIYVKESIENLESIILVAFEDVTELDAVAQMLFSYADKIKERMQTHVGAVKLRQ
jgi:nitrogen-specific signal transduction histidine kinase